MEEEIKQKIDDIFEELIKKGWGEQQQIIEDYITNLQEGNDKFDKTMKDIKDNLIARINRQECEIHNLKEANCKLRKGGETLKDTNKLLLQQKGQLQEDLDMLDKRIDKAIEYIDKELSFNVIINDKENKVIAYNKAFENVRNILEGKNE